MHWIPLLVLLPLVPAGPPEIPADSSSFSEEDEEADGDGSNGPRVGVDLTVASTYVFRGELQYPSPVVPSFQPSIWLDLDALIPGALEISVWSAIAMSERERARRMGTANEVDFAVIYSNAVARGWLELAGGFFYYTYPGADEVDGEKELMLDVAVGNLPLTVAVTMFMEVHPDLGLTLEPRLGWERRFGNVTIGIDILLGASVFRDQGVRIDHTTLSALVAQEVGRLTFGLKLCYTLRVAPPGLDFLERSLLWGALDVELEI